MVYGCIVTRKIMTNQNHPNTMNTAKTNQKSGQNQTAPVQSSNKPFHLLLAFFAFFGLVMQGYSQPTSNAPTPSNTPGVAMYVSSNPGSDSPGIGWYAGWSGVASMGDYTISGGNTVKSYLGLSYAGVEFYNPNWINASPYTTMHVDVYTSNANQLAIKLVSTAGAHGNQAAEIFRPASGGVIISNQWVSLDIPLSEFLAANPNLDLTKLDQLLWIDNGDIAGPGVQLGNFYFDNIYFYSATIPLSASITSPAPGATLTPSFIIAATAAVAPGTITNVNFYDGSTLLGNATSFPYSFPVVNAAIGAHALKVVAQSSTGSSVTSSVVNVTVQSVNLVLFQNGDFDHPSGPGAGCDGSGDYWATNSFGAPFSFSFPTSGGNPNGYAVMDDTGGGSFGVLVGGNVTPVPLAPMGLVAGQTYTFQQDMKILSGSSIGGFKIESWGPSGKISDNGGVYPTLIGDGSTWQTYTFSYTINPAATGLKIVPLWGPNSSVGYDNIGVQVPTTALSVSITSPTNNATVNTNFTVAASTLVSPATVTNVYFYVDNVVVGNSPNYPYTYTSGNAALTGSHALKVVAKASDGSSATSSVVNVTVVAMPQITPNYPITDAPTPTRQATSVQALLNSSGVYANQPVSTWATSWSAPSGLGVKYTNTVTHSVIREYPLLQYAGVDFGPLNLSNYTVMHVDVWSPNAAQFSIKMGSDVVPFTAGTTATTFSNKTWVSLDIPLSKFPSISLSNLGEFLFVDNVPLIENATFYVDNVYFWTTNQVHTSIALGKNVSWTAANSSDYYQPQKSTDGTIWANYGGLLAGNTVTNVFDSSPAPFYQVQDIAPVQVINNGGFESGLTSWTGTGSSTTAAAHSGTTSADINVVNPAGSVYLQQGFNPIVGGGTYNFSVWSELAIPGLNFSAFCLVQYFDSGNAFLSQTQINLTAGTGSWTQNAAILTAPVNATQTQVQIVGTTGAAIGSSGEVYVDDISLSSLTAGTPTTNNIPATVQSGAGITWKSVPGNTYTVQSTSSLNSPVWAQMGPTVIGTGTNTFPDLINSSSKFYRVLEDY